MLIAPPSFLHLGEESLLVIEIVGYYSMVRYCMSVYTYCPPTQGEIILTTQLTAESTVSGNKLTMFTGKNSFVS